MSGPPDPADTGDLVGNAHGGAFLRVRVRPRSRRRGVLGVSGSELVIGVGVPPDKGRANAEALRELARWLDLTPARLAIVSGTTARSKRVSVTGYDAASLRSRIAERLRLDPS